LSLAASRKIKTATIRIQDLGIGNKRRESLPHWETKKATTSQWTDRNGWPIGAPNKKNKKRKNVNDENLSRKSARRKPKNDGLLKWQHSNNWCRKTKAHCKRKRPKAALVAWRRRCKNKNTMDRNEVGLTKKTHLTMAHTRVMDHIGARKATDRLDPKLAVEEPSHRGDEAWHHPEEEKSNQRTDRKY